MSQEHALSAGVHTDGAGRCLPYRLFLPARRATGPLPLVLYLHGAGERGDDNRRHVEVHLGRRGHPGGLFTSDTVQASYPHCFLAPQCPHGSVWRGWAAEAAIELVQRIRQREHVDPDRVYVTGISMGGYGSFYAVERYPEAFAAVVPQSGGGDAGAAPRLVAVPAWIFHGARDEVVPVENARRMVQAITTAGGSPRYTEYPQLGHDIWDTAYGEPDLLPWLFSQRRGEPDRFGSVR